MIEYIRQCVGPAVLLGTDDRFGNGGVAVARTGAEMVGVYWRLALAVPPSPHEVAEFSRNPRVRLTVMTPDLFLSSGHLEAASLPDSTFFRKLRVLWTATSPDIMIQRIRLAGRALLGQATQEDVLSLLSCDQRSIRDWAVLHLADLQEPSPFKRRELTLSPPWSAEHWGP